MTEPEGAGFFCVACSAMPDDTGVVVTRPAGLASCLAVVTGAGGLTVCNVKSPASAPSFLTATGVKAGAEGAAATELAGAAAWGAARGPVDVVAADVSPGSLTAAVVELGVVTESAAATSGVAAVVCAVPAVVVVVAGVAVARVGVAAAVVAVVVVAVVVVAVVVVAVVVVVVDAAAVVAAGLEAGVALNEVVVLANVGAITGGAGGGATKTVALVLATTVATACVRA